PWFKRRGRILDLYETARDIVWLEQDLATRKLCFTPKDDGGRPTIICPLTVQQPETLVMLGARRGDSETHLAREIWIRKTVETKVGDRHELLVFSDRKVRKSKWNLGARPDAIAFAGRSQWILAAERSYRTLVRVGADGGCLAMAPFQDFLTNIEATSDGSLVVGLFGGSQRYVKKLRAQDIKEERCLDVGGHTSPLLEAM